MITFLPKGNAVLFAITLQRKKKRKAKKEKGAEHPVRNY